jgi:hypothetical protein
MTMQDKLKALDKSNVGLAISSLMGDTIDIHGRYTMQCFESEGGALLWEKEFDNVVCTVGKNLALDTILAGSAYTVVGPYMGLISSVSYTATAAGDTMASHSGWLEAGSTNAPTFAARIAPAWSAASAGSKAASSPVSFTMTSSGTLVGAYLVFGTGAVTTLMSTAGTLLSAGAFTGGNQVVSSGNVVTVSYSLGL